MSAIRMCDRCGNVFKEGADGSSVASGTRMVRDQLGRKIQEQVTMDVCPPCNDTPAPAQFQAALEGAEVKPTKVD